MKYLTTETGKSFLAFLERELPRYIDILREMVSINSYTANPAGVNALGDLTAAYFSRLGFCAERVPSSNPSYGDHLVLTKQGKDKKIGFVSHLDTVFTPEEEDRFAFRWRVEGDRAYGPGTVDIKGGTVVALMTLEAVRHAAPEYFDATTWQILLDASEETESHDFGALCRERLAGAAACLVFEAGLERDGVDYLVASRKGRAEFRVIVEGKGAHSGVAHHKGASALRQIADLILRIEAMNDYDKNLTVNVGRMEGGSQINRVPHEATAVGEMRAFDPAVLEQAIARLMEFNGYSSVSSTDGSFSCVTRVELVRRVPAWPRNESSDRLVSCWNEAGRLMSRRVAIESRGGLSDGNFIWDAVPTIDGLGPAGGNPHCSEHDPGRGKEQEYAIISSFAPKAALNALAIIRLFES